MKRQGTIFAGQKGKQKANKTANKKAKFFSKKCLTFAVNGGIVYEHSQVVQIKLIYARVAESADAHV